MDDARRLNGHEITLMAHTVLIQRLVAIVATLAPDAIEAELRDARLQMQDGDAGRVAHEERVTHLKILQMLERGLNREGPGTC